MRTHFRVIALSRFCKSPVFAWQVLFFDCTFPFVSPTCPRSL